MNTEKLIAILQLVAAGFAIVDPNSQAVNFAKIIALSAANYKEITGRDVDPDLIKEYTPIP